MNRPAQCEDRPGNNATCGAARKHKKPCRPARKWPINEAQIAKMAVPTRRLALPRFYDPKNARI